MEAKKLTKKRFNGRYSAVSLQSVEQITMTRQQNAGFTQAMMPVIEKVYDNDEDKREA